MITRADGEQNSHAQEHDGFVNHQTNGNGRDDHELVDETQVPHNERVGQIQGPPIDFAQHTPRLRRSHALQALGEVVLPHQARNAVADGERIARLDQVQSQIDQRLEQERCNQSDGGEHQEPPFGVDAHLAGPFESPCARYAFSWISSGLITNPMTGTTAANPRMSTKLLMMIPMKSRPARRRSFWVSIAQTRFKSQGC